MANCNVDIIMPTRLLRLFCALSGLAALIYQVAWLRKLSLLLGVTAEAVGLTLSVFMAGLALGSWLGARWSEKARNPLRAFAWTELGVCIAGGLTPVVLVYVGDLHANLALQYSLSESAQWAFRIIVAFAVLFVPTTLMGLGFPLLLAVIQRSCGQKTAEEGALLYSANLLGAIFGVFIAGFLLIPQFGVVASISIAALTNLIVSVMAFCFALSPALLKDLGGGVATTGSKIEEISFNLSPELSLIAAGFFVSGFCCFAYETVWTRWIILLLGANSNYAFSIVVLTFLIGSFIGTRRSALNLKRIVRPAAAFSLVLSLIGLCGVVLCVVVGLLPGLVNQLPISARSQHIVCVILSLSFLLALPLLSGAAFAIAAKQAAEQLAGFSRTVGTLYALNTLGCVGGALCAAFVLLPYFGLQRGTLILSVLIFVFGGTLVFLCRPPWLTFWRAGGAVVLMLILTPLVFVSPPPISARIKSQQEQILFYREDAVTSVAVVEERTSGRRKLLTGGEFQAGNSRADLSHLLLLGHLPALFCKEQRDALVVGLGAGFTVSALTQHPFERIEIVEVSRAVVEANTYFGEWTGDPVRKDPRVTLRLQDGRNFLRTVDRRWDVITTDPIDPDDAGASVLYSKEYYQLVREHLRPGGVAAQWLNPHFGVDNYRMLVATFSSVFPFSIIWRADYTTVAIGFAMAPTVSRAEFERRLNLPAVQTNLAAIGMATSDALLGQIMAGPQRVVELSKGVALVTDDFPRTEYLWLHGIDPNAWEREFILPPDSLNQARRQAEADLWPLSIDSE